MNSVTIISVAPYELTGTPRPETPVTDIPAKPKGLRFAAVVVEDGVSVKRIGFDATEVRETISAMDIARDLIGERAPHGILIIAGDKPTEEELERAEATRKAFNLRKLAEGDVIWSQSHSQKNITIHHRNAVRELHVARDWSVDISEQVQCPGCSSLVAPTAVKCPNCNAILNWQGAYDLGILTPDQEANAIRAKRITLTPEGDPVEPPVKRPVGRPRKEVTV